MSIVIPVRDEEESLPVLIQALLAQSYPPDEVVIVDGGSTDKTVALARSFAMTDQRLRLIEAGEATPGRGRNVGIAAARNDLIALIDAGIRPESTWLEELITTFARQPDGDVVYGNFEAITETFFERCAALAYVPAKQERSGGRIRGPFIASSLLRRDVWQSVDGFPDLRAAEDLIFMERIAGRGWRISWAPKATVWWRLQPTLNRTFRKFMLYSKHNVWAGRQGDWHYGIARQYVVAALFVGLALIHSRWWWLPVAFGFGFRVAKSIWRRREGRGLLWALNPLQFLGVGLIIVAIDVATFAGWVQALVSRPEEAVG